MDTRQKPELFPVPLIADFDELNHRFTYDDTFAFKNPDWTYSLPAPTEAPVPLHYLDLNQEMHELQSTESWKSSDRMVKTLAKQGNLRLVLTLMKGGTTLKGHKAEGGVSILVLRGHIRIKVDTNDVELEQSQMMVLNPGARHSVEALEETAFLISISG